ncbi:30S ribosomal protein S9, mitochondrial-like [Lolium rigidum]|uniref:30S ribosomal protein S9, mitochondrial-like n=1 Tax=Lolium rigidum TaxID=89674 RepID=UPI001F5C1044|nr:30S ribosomal protein S9, mitochondrial-like [Lolium rigidum]
MLLRRLLHPSHHLRRGLQTLTTTTNAVAAAPSSSSAPLPFRRLPARFPSPRFLSTSGGGGDDDTRNPWAFTAESSDPDPFADVDPVAAAPGEAPVGSSAVAEDTWAKDFGAEDGEKGGDVFEEIFKDAAAATPAARNAAPAEDTEPWTIDLEDEKDDPFAAAVMDDEVAGIGGEAAEIEELVAGKDEDAERQREENRAREQQLMETLKGPDRAFGDLVSASGITEDMIDSLILLKDARGVPGLPPLSEIQDRAIQKMNATSSRAEVERQLQEEIAKARVRQVDEQGRAYGTGKRKCSIARVWIQPGDGKFVVNEKQFDAYFPILDHRADLLRPFTVTKTLGLWDVACTVKGGGVSGQVGAVRLGISRALQNWEPGLRPYLKSAGYLTRDSRVVERKKPGKAKARKSFQWVKR